MRLIWTCKKTPASVCQFLEFRALDPNLNENFYLLHWTTLFISNVSEKQTDTKSSNSRWPGLVTHSSFCRVMCMDTDPRYVPWESWKGKGKATASGHNKCFYLYQGSTQYATCLNFFLSVHSCCTEEFITQILREDHWVQASALLNCNGKERKVRGDRAWYPWGVLSLTVLECNAKSLGFFSSYSSS